MSSRRRNRSFRWPRRLLLWGLATGLLVALLFPVAAGALLTRLARTRPQDIADRRSPAEHGAAYRTVFLETADGVRISSWLLPAKRPAGCSVVLAHGLFRSRLELLERAVWLSERGCRVLSVDLRRHGGSGGERTTLGANEALDVLAAAEFLGQRFRGERIFLLGISMGGAAAAGAGVLLAEPPAGVVLDSTFRTAAAVVGRYAQLFFGLPEFPTRDMVLFGMGLAGDFRPRDLDVEGLSARLGARGVPVLVIAGGRDEQAPAGEQEAVFRANGLPESRFLRIDAGGHGNSCLVDPGACEAEMIRFLGIEGPNEGEPGGAGLFYDPEG